MSLDPDVWAAAGRAAAAELVAEGKTPPPAFYALLAGLARGARVGREEAPAEAGASWKSSPTAGTTRPTNAAPLIPGRTDASEHRASV